MGVKKHSETGFLTALSEDFVHGLKVRSAEKYSLCKWFSPDCRKYMGTIRMKLAHPLYCSLAVSNLVVTC
jgi:hypothetical protein